jgi:predicted SAM-dependent methyltransferase
LIIQKDFGFRGRFAWQPDCRVSGAAYLCLVKLNLGCWIFYREGYINIDRDPKVRADRYEDIATLPSFGANCADEIYAGHVAEHVEDVKIAFGRWFEVLKPGGRITITVPDCRGANRMWLERQRFPALEVGPDEGIIQITTGVKTLDVDDEMRAAALHYRVFDESTLRICMEAVGFTNIVAVDNHEAMVAPCSSLGWQIALEGYKPNHG